MNKKVFLNEKPDEINYTVHYPDDYRDLPLLVYLHGAGERGKDISHLERHGIPQLLAKNKEFNAVVLCLQCPAMFVWDNVVEKVKDIIDKTVSDYDIKKDRICLTGSSMGGFGTFAVAMTYNNFFSAIAPVAGGSMAWRAGVLKTTPVYAFHGEKDTVVIPEYSKFMVEAINKAGGSAKLVLLPELGHNDGIDYTYENTDIIDWLLSRRRTDFTRTPEICEELF